MSADRTPEQWGRVAESIPGFTHTFPWARLPDAHGRVYRRNWCLTDSGFGHTQVAGPKLRAPRDSSRPIDPDDPGNEGCLRALLGARVELRQEPNGWRATYRATPGVAGDGGETTDPQATPGRAYIELAEIRGVWPCGGREVPDAG